MNFTENLRDIYVGFLFRTFYIAYNENHFNQFKEVMINVYCIYL